MPGSSRIERLRAMLGAKETHPEEIQANPKAVDANTPPTNTKIEKFSGTASGQEQVIFQHAVHPMVASSHKTAIIQKTTASVESTETVKDIKNEAEFGSVKGKPASVGGRFSPFLAVTKLCYKYCPRALLQPISVEFFASGKIFERGWDIYCINSEYGGTVTFVQEHHLQKLSDEINDKFPDANFQIENPLKHGLLIDFENFPWQLCPRFLGRIKSREQYQTLCDEMNQRSEMKPSTYATSDRSLEAWKHKMDLAIEAGKQKHKAAKERKLQESTVKKQGYIGQMLRAQRYLGLLPKNDSNLLNPGVSSLSVPAIDITKPPMNIFDSDVIFLAIDVEAWEDPPRPVTEIGLAILDTQDLHGIAPGRAGEEWHQYIRGRHFRINEHKNKVNFKYLQGCPDRFEFGNSEFVSMSALASVLSSCLRELSGKAPESHSNSTTKAGPRNVPTAPRKLIIVGHDLLQDIAYCHSIGFSVLNHGGIIDTIDSAALFRAHTHDPNARSLGNVMYHFDFAAWNLHNAGNDAVYTIEAMLAICVEAASERGSEQAQNKHEDIQQKREKELIDAAKERASEDAKGWSPNPGDDGGVPVPPTEEDFQPKGRRQVSHTD